MLSDPADSLTQQLHHENTADTGRADLIKKIAKQAIKIQLSLRSAGAAARARALAYVLAD